MVKSFEQGGVKGTDDCEPAPSFDHVMIDIESMSLSRHNALILSVGMIEFDPEPLDGPTFGKRSLLIPRIAEQLSLCREVSQSTQKFWKDQKPEASDHWLNYGGERMSLVSVCDLIREFCRGKSRVWANGNQFDLANLEELNRVTGGKDLWHYQAPRDMRTFVRETPQTRLVPIGDAIDIPGVPHEPVYDCIVQAYQVWAHWING
jgi:hypothetical protein